jgi:hypothetical protein
MERERPLTSLNRPATTHKAACGTWKAAGLYSTTYTHTIHTHLIPEKRT